MPPEAGKAAPGGGPAAPAAAPSRVTQADLQPDAPDQYTVVKGDTLWGIAGRFLKDPWKWPQIWQMNQDQIKNPHLIYPGDVIRLDRDAAGGPRLALGSGGPGDAAANVVKLEPRVRVQPLEAAIPSIPGPAIAPFLNAPLIIEADGLDAAPAILATEENRVVVGAGDRVYADRIGSLDGVNWQIFRPGTAIKDPETGAVLGYEAKYVGDARVRRFGSPGPTTLEVLKARQEINRGDRLQPARESVVPSYVPRAPDRPIKATVLAVDGGVLEFGLHQVVSINRGSRDGLQVGHVLAIARKGELVDISRDGDFYNSLRHVLGGDIKPVPVVPDPPRPPASTDPKVGAVIESGPVRLPDERVGLLFVFRVFERMSYGIVMRATRPMFVGDYALSP